MVRFHVVDHTNRGRYAAAMDAHHRVRARLYIEGRKWRALSAPDGREVDQFDLPSTRYIFGLTEAGDLVSGSRLHPSTGPTLMADVFPQLAAVRGLERAPDVWEWTRVFVDPARRRSEAGPAPEAGAIYCAVLQHALDRGIRSLNIVTEMFYLERYVALGWRIRVLGEPLDHEGMSLVGINVQVEPAAIAATREFYGIGPTVFVDPPRRGRRDRIAPVPAV